MRVLGVAFACMACILHARRMQPMARAQSTEKGRHEPQVAPPRFGDDALDHGGYGTGPLGLHGGGLVHNDWSATPLDPSINGHSPWIPPEQTHTVLDTVPEVKHPERQSGEVTKPETPSGEVTKPEKPSGEVTKPDGEVTEPEKPANDVKKPPKKSFRPKKPPKQLQAFTPGEPSIEMTDAVKQKLANGGIWQSTELEHFKASLDGKVISSKVVMDVGAHPSVIWHQILDFDAYPSKVPSVKKAQVYKTEQSDGFERYWVEFHGSPLPGQVRIMGYALDRTFYVKYTYEPRKNSITWELDQERENEIDDVKGHWHVEPNPEDSSKSRVYFEFAIAIPKGSSRAIIPHSARVFSSLAPHWVKDLVVHQVGSLVHYFGGVTSWLKHGSETIVTNGEIIKLRPLQKNRLWTVDQSIEDVLENDKVWTVVTANDDVVTGQAIVDIEAMPHVNAAWDQLFDFEADPEKAPEVHSSTEVYKRESSGSSWWGGTVERTFVKFVSRLTLGVEITNHLDFTYDKPKKSITFKLDPEQSNDLDELQGHFQIVRCPDDPNKARVFYEIGVVGPELPGWLLDKLVHRAINQETSWVKKESDAIGTQDVDTDLGELDEQLSPYLIAAAAQMQ